MSALRLSKPAAVSAGLVIAVAVAMIVYREAAASSRVDDGVRFRNAINATLHASVNTQPQGVAVILPPTNDKLAGFVNPLSDEAHIRSVLNQRDWQESSQFQLLLELTPSALPAEKQGSSETMAATVLLNHYFGGLEKIGLSRRGSQGVVIGKVQSSRNEWHDPMGNFYVDGAVFVSPESKQAIVIGHIRAHLSN
ncbi:hypothetical protein [Botrimarina mediterranea]|uniref:Uncharacterized protein n=1 Tax=Botrimarina mediterranea TaxID=2528022 RepID=A0A518KAQ7_9BACT|nr:hypothetical protein [Botrimarina mediterranea]QDV74871.1 hypothetical protein Spa11_30800 [Botrimarina mediterranea]QDV79514.1 hypothetical protein K2D_31290 [Planctomycetes bacterium K2D]